MQTLEPFQLLIKERCGFAFKANAVHTLETSIRQRMAELGIEELSRYLRVIKFSAEELHKLIDLITINETYFFREKQHFDVLCKILGDRLAGGLHGKIKILSAGCSTGEEAYSIVISLVERFGFGIMENIEVHGVDIDRNAIKAADAAIYRGNSFRTHESMLMRFFVERADQAYELLPVLKQGVRFQVGNLLELHQNPALQGMDVIFYRNVSIYFEREVQQLIFKGLTDILNHDGYLFLGASETYGHDVGILPLIEHGNVFVYHKKRHHAPTRAARPAINNVRRPQSVSVQSPSQALPPLGKGRAARLPQSKPADEKTDVDLKSLFDKALLAAKHKDNNNALGMIDEILAMDASCIKAHALKASILLNLQKLREAGEVCQSILALDEWNIEGYILLGMMARMEGDCETALHRLRTALYLRASCWLAHFFMAEIYAECLDADGARREYSVTLKLLEKQGIDDHGLTLFPLSFSVDQLINLCRHNIHKMASLQQK
ncbi:MAG: hypothetical protein EPN21_14365 [Methylococcaceae bacterium]|nr:MAG: hypothetical protein EPN21_14365 [Methylococcaceae bacterium]